MLSRCFLDDSRASIDKLAQAPPPAFLSLERWRKPLKTEVAKVTLDLHYATTSGANALSIKQRERSCYYQLQVARFYEVLVRPGMLLNRQYPRRSHYAPRNTNGQERPSLGSVS